MATTDDALPSAQAGHELGSEGVMDKRPVVLVTTVELGGGQSTDIEVRQGDSAKEVAERFIAANALPAEVLGPLVRHLKTNLEKPAITQAGVLLDHTPGRRGRSLSPRALDSAMGKLGRAPNHAQPVSAGQGSKNLLLSKKDSKPAVAMSLDASLEAHHRLYDQAKSLQQKLEQQRRKREAELDEVTRLSSHSMTWVSRQMTKGRSAGGFRNSGERLYAMGLHDAEKKKAEAQRMRTLRDEEEARSMTGTPRLSKMAQQIERPNAPWSRLHTTNISRSMARVMQIKAAQEEAEQQECTFHPAINERSEKIATKTAAAASRYELLYKDATHRQRKQQDLAASLPEEYTFTPRLQTRRPHPSAGAPVSERLYQVQRQWQARAEARRWLQERPLDPDSGRPLFQPQTGRHPNFDRNRSGDVGTYLHSIQSQRDHKQAAKLGQREQQRTAYAVTRPLGKSLELVSRLKAKRFALVYGYLTRGQAEGQDLDLLALTSEPDSPKLAALHAEVRQDVEAAARILARRLASQDGGGHDRTTVVDLYHFSQLMEEAVAGSGGGPRAYLAPAHAPVGADTPSFQPAIDARSRVLAAKKRPEGKPAYQVLHETADDMRRRHFEQLLAQQDARLQECTFEPDLSMTQGRSKSSGSRQSLKKPGPMSKSMPTFEELEHEVEAALRECEMLSAPHDESSLSAAAGQGHQAADDLQMVPAIERWTSDQDGYVAELGLTSSIRVTT